MNTRRTLSAFVVALLLAGGTSVEAQYFGRAPVQWERLQFQILKTEHFDIYYYGEEADAATQAGRMAERWYARLSRILGTNLTGRQPLILYASQGQFQQTNTVGGSPGESTGGVTEAFKRRIVLPLGASLQETDHVIGHELTHAFQYSMTGQGRISAGNYPSALNMPLWFIEGMAEYLSLGPVDPNTAMWMRDASLKGKFPSISDLDSSKYFPYRYGQALWAYLAGRFGERIFGEALRKVGARTNDADQVLKDVVHVDAKTLSKDWKEALTASVTQETKDKQEPDAYGPAITKPKERGGGKLNVAPALDPEGGRLAFLSERDAYSIELFLADAQSGQVLRRLSHSAVDSHIESLQFVASAGAWDREGRRFALAVVSKERPLLLVIDPATGQTLREVPFPQLGEIATPSFSPDGRRIVFSALSSGFTDLYVYDLQDDHLSRLTEDAFADLQPAWSPDGKTIAFVTDRFTTRLEPLAYGDYRLATIDPETRTIAALPSFAHGKSINPQWSPTGDSLYFLSDATGFSNVYRMEMATGEAFQLTDLRTGASGITAISPGLSVAAAKGKLAYSVYEKGRYDIYTIDDASKLKGTRVALDNPPASGVIPGALNEGQVVAARADAETGLPDADTFKRSPYHARLGLDYIGQPYVEGGVVGGQGAFAGGISMSFSDMLGENSLDTLIQAQSVSGFTDVGAMVSYVNRRRRLNWGVEVGQIPYVSQYLMSGVTTDSSGAYVDQILTERLLERTVSAIGFYPLNDSMRLEMQAGYQYIGYSAHLDSYSYLSGQYLTSTDLPGSTSLSLASAGVAFVRDVSVFGATSPIVGQRFRVEVTPVVGDVQYTSVLADFRQYLMPVTPITVAARVLHFGRYGSGSDDNRLYPAYLGDVGLVRGYTADSFDVSECGSAANGTCPVFDRLVGSRMVVGNVEVRAPLFGLFTRTLSYGPVPIEVGAFFDAGVAWDRNSQPLQGERKIVKSVGAVARLNVFGVAVLEADYAKPLDRPGKGMVFQFNLVAGF